MSSKPNRNHLTEEQIEILRANEYVQYVSASTVKFTEEFKRLFCERRRSGVISRNIFLDCGIDPDILGEKRIEGFRYTMKKLSDSGGDFSDGRAVNFGFKRICSDGSMESRLRAVEHELAYTRQEVEFLKKTQKADSEALRQWEARHQQR